MAHRDIVVVGCSAGGLDGLSALIGALPPAFPAALFVVQHFPEGRESALPRILSRLGPLPAEHAEDGQRFELGRIYVAPPGQHLELLPDRRLRLSTGAREHGLRPAVDPLFRTAARAYGPRVIGVILSGNLDDGSAGAMEIEECGGVVLLQDPATAPFSGMTASALQALHRPLVAHPEELGPSLKELARGELPVFLAPRGNEPEPETRGVPALSESDKPPGLPVEFTCPECGGALWEDSTGRVVQYRCHTGHRYAELSLFSEQGRALESALARAARALKERAFILRRMADRAIQRGDDSLAGRYTRQAEESQQSVSSIEHILHRRPSPSQD